MLINMRDNENNLRIKDILDVDFDMYVEKEDNKFYVRVNRLYQLDEVFEKREDAEFRMRIIARIRNQEEEELRNY